MKKIATFAASALIAISASGCAKTPESIAPAYVSAITYQSLNCNQLAMELSNLQSAYRTAAVQQDNARGNDVVGIILLGLPVSSLSGDNIAPQIAHLKGQINAVNKAVIAKQCTAAPEIPRTRQS